MIAIPIVAVGFLVMWIVEILATFGVYGWFVKDEDLGVFLNQDYLDTLYLNPYNINIMTKSGPSYIAKGTGSLARWHIKDLGIVPRWSKYSKILDRKHRELLMKHSI